MSEDWRDDALCRQVDPELFFTAGRSDASRNREQIRQAKSVCHLCPVASQCLAWALATSQEYGVWGGLSEEERRPLAASRRPSSTTQETRLQAACRMKADGVPVKDIAWQLSISVSSVKRYLYRGSK